MAKWEFLSGVWAILKFPSDTKNIGLKYKDEILSLWGLPFDVAIKSGEFDALLLLIGIKG